MIFSCPELDPRELELCAELDELRTALQGRISEPLVWVGLLRRVTSARAIRGSNSIEGFEVELDDAVAAVDGGAPLNARREAWAAVSCYRDAMTNVLQMADDPTFAFEESLIKSLHFQMLRYDLTKRPGRWRVNNAYVRDDRSGAIVYEGPDPRLVPALTGELVRRLREASADVPVLVRAAMAHLNLAMIHPFSDGNGRMARGLQTLVLVREGDLNQEYVSIEEYLGRNTRDYYDVLARVGGRSWNPDNDARPWVRFNLAAHYFQINTLLRRSAEADRRWSALEHEVHRLGLPDRSVGAVWDAALGFRVRNSTYRGFAEVSLAVAGRDLKSLVSAGLLTPQGNARGRYYVASDRLRDIESTIRSPRRPIQDPFKA